jgi:hypothetical protein
MDKTIPIAMPATVRSRPLAASRAVALAAVALMVIGIPAGTLVASAAPTSGWQGPTLAETVDGLRIMKPQVAVDGEGNAFALWYTTNGTRNLVWSSRTYPGAGWGPATQLAPEIPGNGYQNPAIAVGGNGDVFAVWEQSNGSVNNIWANRYAAGWGWGRAALIEFDDAGSAGSPQVAVDGSGNAFVVWSQSDGTRNNIWSTLYAAGSGWGTPQLIERDSVGSAADPQVSANADGAAFAVWTVQTGPNRATWSNHYLAGVGWSREEALEPTDTTGTSGPQVAADSAGNAVAVWQQYDGVRSRIFWNGYAVDQGWGSAALVQRDDTVNAQNPRIALDSRGDGFAAWSQVVDVSFSNQIAAARYTAGKGFQEITPFQRDELTYAVVPDVAVDAGGNAVVVWEEESRGGPNINVSANRYVFGSGWQGATRIAATPGTDSRDPQVAAGPNGEAVAVWGQFDVSPLGFNVWSDRYFAVDTTAPTVTLSSPSTALTTNRSSVWVAGTTEVGAQVTVNGAAATVDGQGNFGLVVGLLPGANLITATAWDASGNRASAFANMTFDDPVPSLEDQLAAAQSDLAAAQARVSALETSATSTQAQLQSARTALSVAEGKVASLQSGATNVSAELAADQARIAALETNRTAAQPPAAGGDTGMAIVLALAGLAVGALGCALALRRPKRPAPVETRSEPAPPPTDPPRP